MLTHIYAQINTITSVNSETTLSLYIAYSYLFLDFSLTNCHL